MFRNPITGKINFHGLTLLSYGLFMLAVLLFLRPVIMVIGWCFLIIPASHFSSIGGQLFVSFCLGGLALVSAFMVFFYAQDERYELIKEQGKKVTKNGSYSA